MTPEEIKIEESAERHYNELPYENSKYSFITGAKSQVAKEYHTKGMYTEEEVDKIVRRAYQFGFEGGMYENTDFITHQHDCNSITKWFEKNKKK